MKKAVVVKVAKMWNDTRRDYSWCVRFKDLLLLSLGVPGVEAFGWQWQHHEDVTATLASRELHISEISFGCAWIPCAGQFDDGERESCRVASTRVLSWTTALGPRPPERTVVMEVSSAGSPPVDVLRLPCVPVVATTPARQSEAGLVFIRLSLLNSEWCWTSSGVRVYRCHKDQVSPQGPITINLKRMLANRTAISPHSNW